MEGIKNNVFKREDVERVADARMEICTNCSIYDPSGEGCMVVGTAPCCNQDKGGCGCSLTFKTRSLSSECPKGYWLAEMTQEEEDKLNEKLGI
jgi:hypothetical protein